MVLLKLFVNLVLKRVSKRAVRKGKKRFYFDVCYGLLFFSPLLKFFFIVAIGVYYKYMFLLVEMRVIFYFSSFEEKKENKF